MTSRSGPCLILHIFEDGEIPQSLLLITQGRALKRDQLGVCVRIRQPVEREVGFLSAEVRNPKEFYDLGVYKDNRQNRFASRAHDRPS